MKWRATSLEGKLAALMSACAPLFWLLNGGRKPWLNIYTWSESAAPGYYSAGSFHFYRVSNGNENFKRGKISRDTRSSNKLYIRFMIDKLAAFEWLWCENRVPFLSCKKKIDWKMRRELVIENINFVSFLFLSLLIFVYDLKIK